MKPQSKTWYRPDIDGLRALAIIPVILFHAKIAGFSGGFVGVDIFFVISGYLITSIIYRELKNGTFSFLTFWERRVRRIVPALFVVMSATLIAGYFIILYPIDFIDLGQSIFAQSLFLANIFFMRNSGYFATTSETMPLLHTWSLAVEEQFYIGFPILMFLLWRYGRRALIPTLLTLGGLSLLYGHYLLSVAPGDGFSIPGVPNVWGGALNMSAAFYFLPARAFELLIGSVLALTTLTIKSTLARETVATIGLGMICYAIFGFSHETTFPGLAALLPTLGAGAIILANTHKQTMVGELLSFPLFVWIGLISYSLYLWHWPLLVFAHITSNTHTLSSSTTLLVISATFILAYVTYRFVETPFRVKRFLSEQKAMLFSGIGALLLLAFAGLYIQSTQGMPERSSDTALAIAAATVDFYERRNECFVNAFSTNNEPCYIGNQEKETVDFMIWGDSHAASLLPVINDTAREAELKGATFINPGCLPVMDTTTDPIIKKCQDVKELAVAFAEEHSIQHIVLIARWSGYRKLVPSTQDEFERTENMSGEALEQFLFEDSLLRMAKYFEERGTNLYFVEQVPTHGDYDARQLFYAAIDDPDMDDLTGTSYEETKKRNAFVDQTFNTLANTTANTTVLDPADLLCPDKKACLLMQDGVLLYENKDHINKTGSYLLAPLFRKLFTQL